MAAQNQSRGLRNNNPLNIRHSKDNWKGKAAMQTDKSFVQFRSIEYGYRAALCLLRTYINKYKRNTIDSIVKAWAPPTENNTEAYINTVVAKTGIGRYQPIKFTDKDALVDIVAAMSCVENGVIADKDAVRKGYELV